ncbi:uncharacterized protein LOC144642410 [Oculina patagonica]
MTQLLAVSVMMLCMTTAYGIDCYTCNSTESAQECVERQKLVSCPFSKDRCRSSFITIKIGNIESSQLFFVNSVKLLHCLLKLSETSCLVPKVCDSFCQLKNYKLCPDPIFPQISLAG